MTEVKFTFSFMTTYIGTSGLVLYGIYGLNSIKQHCTVDQITQNIVFWTIYHIYLVAGGQEVVSSSLVTRTIENRWYHWVSAVFTFFWNRNLTVLTTNLPTYRNFTDIFYFYFSLCKIAAFELNLFCWIVLCKII
jgi:hypothetical protein